jgi:putative PIN family toxin of toxin-antitoxin system
MNTSRRIVFDTSTLVSVALCPSSFADRAFSLALKHGVVCVCEQSLERLRFVLSGRKFDRYMAKRVRVAFVDLLRNTGWMCLVFPADVYGIRLPSRGRRNHAIFALAAAAEADAIVSGDNDLLTRKAWRKIPIVPPAEFVSWYDRA